MSISFSHAFGRVAVVCVVAVSSLGTVFASRAAASTVANATNATTSTTASTTTKIAPRTIASEKISLGSTTRAHYPSTPVKLSSREGGGGGDDILAFPPATATPAQAPMTVVYLHGIRGRAENGCPWLRSGASELGWLVCPHAVDHDTSNNTWSWGFDINKQSAIVDNAVRAAQANGASSEPGVAVGFSQGAYVTLDLVKTNRGHFRGLVLIAGPDAHPSAQKLREAGIKRMALASGSLDAAYAPLVEDTKRLQREGMEARFFDLGRVGHTYAAEDTEALREAIAWAGGIRE